MMKKVKLLGVAVTAFTVAGLAQAADHNPPSPDKIQELSNQIEALAKASVRSVNELAYKVDQSFPLSMQLNIKQADIQNSTRLQTEIETDRAIKRDLQPFSSTTLTYTNKSQPEVQKVNAETNDRQNFINQLQNLEASDTIYSLVQGMDASAYWTKKNIGAPGRNDDAFSFAALIEPEIYSAEQVKNSQNFIGYATKQYQSYTDGLDLPTLRNALLQYQKQGVKALSQQIDQFRSNTAYKNYQLTIRSLTASTSVATDILSGMAEERKPIIRTEADPQLDAISRFIGVEPQVVSVKNADGDSVTMYRYASPMQISKFRANYRLNNSQWYQEVAGDSAENLQRKSVLLQSEMVSQLYQNHLDNEKILGALAMLILQSKESGAMMLKTQVTDVNSAIASFAAAASGSTQQQDTTSTTNSTSTSTDPNSYSTDPNSYNANTQPPSQ